MIQQVREDINPGYSLIIPTLLKFLKRVLINCGLLFIYAKNKP